MLVGFVAKRSPHLYAELPARGSRCFAEKKSTWPKSYSHCAASVGQQLRVMQSRLRRPLVVDAAWRRHDRVRPRFSLDHLTSRPLTRYERLAFLFAIAIPRSHRSLPPLVPV